ncbi:conserved hypothetical protein [Xanthomonas phaseoli pv. phaseoli]|nr:conserved hypothetical protein [Xanthomonas phaseoli pv. phaseoli]
MLSVVSAIVLKLSYKVATAPWGAKGLNSPMGNDVEDLSSQSISKSRMPEAWLPRKQLNNSMLVEIIMRFSYFYIFVLAFYADISYAEGGCPAGQYPIGGQGAMACAPIPQTTQQQQKPQGTWVKTWGAIAMGFIDSTTSYGVTTGKPSKAEAEADALRRCASHGEKNCQIGLSYRNQCAVIAEAQINGKPFPNGSSEFIGASTESIAGTLALEKCQKKQCHTGQCPM